MLQIPSKLFSVLLRLSVGATPQYSLQPPLSIGILLHTNNGQVAREEARKVIERKILSQIGNIASTPPLPISILPAPREGSKQTIK